MATLFEMIKSTGNFSRFIQSVEQAGLVETLKDRGPWTVFVPTNAAFEQLASDKREKLQEKGEKLTKVAKYHIVSGFYTTNDLLDHLFLRTLEGQRIFLDSLISALPDREVITVGSDAYRYVIENQVTTTIQQSITVNKATVVIADQRADNGVFHAIDQILIPKLLIL